MKKILTFLVILTGCGRYSTIDREQFAVELPLGPINKICNVDYQSIDDRAAASFIVFDQGATEEIKISHLNELMLLPSHARNFLVKHNAGVYLTSGAITDFKRFEHLRGVVPRGWENTGYTWDVVPGAGDRQGAYLGHPGLPHNANSLGLHEIGHTLDFLVGWSRDSDSWREAFQYWRERPALDDPNRAYRMSHIEEFIAIAIDDALCSTQTRENLEQWYPGLVELVEKNFEQLLQVSFVGQAKTKRSFLN